MPPLLVAHRLGWRLHLCDARAIFWLRRVSLCGLLAPLRGLRFTDAVALGREVKRSCAIRPGRWIFFRKESNPGRPPIDALFGPLVKKMSLAHYSALLSLLLISHSTRSGIARGGASRIIRWASSHEVLTASSYRLTRKHSLWRVFPLRISVANASPRNFAA